jgi:MSHA biogenesis protein MshN
VTPSATPQVPAAQPAPSVSKAQSIATNDAAPEAGREIPAVSAAPPAVATAQSDANIVPANQLKLDKQLNETALMNALLAAETEPSASAKPSAAPKAKGATGKPAASRVPARSSDSRTPADINNQVKELSPQQRAENEYRKAISLMQQGRIPETIAGLGQTLQFDPQHAAARQTLVELLLDSRRQDEAISRLQEGLGLDPNQPGLAMILARLQVEKGEIRPAVDTLLRTLPHAADRADYQAFLAALLQREGRHKEAIEHYGLALRKSPQNGVWWMGLGISLQAANRLPDARDAFGRAKASNALSPELLAYVEQQLNQLR